MRRSAVLLAFALAACAAAPPPQPAQAAAPAAPPASATAAERGHDLAVRVCSACHALAPGQASPRPPAPPFPTFAGRFTELTLNRRLTEISETGHTQMPTLAVHSDEVEDLVAYLNSQPAP